MKKQIFAVSLFVSLVLILSGCGLQTKSQNQEQGRQLQEVPITEQQLQQTEEDFDLAKEMLNLDASMDDMKDTGFSEAELSDSSLGI